jgi:hypothetical protein
MTTSKIEQAKTTIDKTHMMSQVAIGVASAVAGVALVLMLPVAAPAAIITSAVCALGISVVISRGCTKAAKAAKSDLDRAEKDHTDGLMDEATVESTVDKTAGTFKSTITK